MASSRFVNSPKSLLILLLALTTVGGAAFAWRQYAELVELRALAMNKDERADFQKRVWDLEKANRELQDRLAARRDKDPDSAESALVDATEDRSDRGGRGGRGGDGRGRGGPPPQFAAIRELMNKPEVQAMVATQQKAAVEARYAALFKSLNLSPEQSEQLKSLLVERQTSRQDLFEAARAQGIDPRENPEAYRKLLTDSRNEFDSSIKGVIGESGLAQLQSYEQTLPQRNIVDELQKRLSYSNTPLTATQADQLVQILAANTPPPSRPASSNPTTPGQTGAGDRGPGRGGDFGRGPDLGMLGGLIGGGPGGPGGPGGMMGVMMDGGRGGIVSAPITTTAVNQAQAVLSQPQVSALQQLQKQQQTQQQLATLVHTTLTTPPAQTGTTTSGAAGSGGSSTAPAPTQQKRGPRGGG